MTLRGTAIQSCDVTAMVSKTGRLLSDWKAWDAAAKRSASGAQKPASGAPKIVQRAPKARARALTKRQLEEKHRAEMQELKDLMRQTIAGTPGIPPTQQVVPPQQCCGYGNHRKCRRQHS